MTRLERIAEIKMLMLKDRQNRLFFNDGVKNWYEGDDGYLSSRYFKIEFRDRGKHTLTPIIIDCDNKSKLSHEEFELEFKKVVEFLESLSFSVYVWKTSSHKAYYGYHIMTGECVDWERSTEIMKQLAQFHNVIDPGYIDGSIGEQVNYWDGKKENIGGQIHTCRVSPKYPIEEGKETIYDLIEITNVNSDDPLHIQWRSELTHYYNEKENKI